MSRKSNSQAQSSTALVPTELAPELAKYSEQAQGVLAMLREHACDTQDDLEWFGQARIKIDTQRKAVDARRTAITKPLNAAKREVDALFAPTLKGLEACSALALARPEAKLAEQRQAQFKALQAVQHTPGGVVGEDTLAVAHGVENLSAPEGIREVSSLSFEIEDEAAVPAQWKRTCAELVQAEVERTKGACKIPGIRVVREFAVARKAGART